MKDSIKIRKQEQHGLVTWALEVVEKSPWSVGQPRFEVRGEVARLVVEMPDYIARMLADELGGLPFYPSPLDATEQLGHAVRELANAAGEMSRAAKTLHEPTVKVVAEGPPMGFCNWQDHRTLGAHMQADGCVNWQYAYRERR